jgi:hypothetical protein
MMYAYLKYKLGEAEKDCNLMDLLQGILGFAVFIGIGFLTWKGINSTAGAANRHILFRFEYQEGKQLVTEPLTIRAKAPMQDVLCELERNVTVAPDHSAYKAAVYISSRGADHITYMSIHFPEDQNCQTGRGLVGTYLARKMEMQLWWLQRQKRRFLRKLRQQEPSAARTIAAQHKALLNYHNPKEMNISSEHF